MLAPLVLTLLAQTAPEPTRLSFSTSPTLEYWLLTRAVVAGEASGLPLDGMDQAVAILRAAEADGVVVGPLADAAMADAESMESAAEALTAWAARAEQSSPGTQQVKQARVGAQAARALAATEASFREQHWQVRQTRLEQLGTSLDEWLGDRHDEAMAFLLDGLGAADPQQPIPVRLVTTMPSPGGLTVRTAAGPLCLVALADGDGDPRPLAELAEVVLHEALHALEAVTGPEGEVLGRLRAGLLAPEVTAKLRPAQAGAAARNLPHAWIFAHTSALLEQVFGVARPHYPERAGVYARMGETAEFLAVQWAQHVRRQLAAGQPLSEGAESFVEQVLLYLQRERQPNLLLILADDQGWADFSYLGLNEDATTPRLDRLAAEGITMPQAYASSPICNPSRVGLITGRYQQRWGNFYYGGGQGLPSRAVTLAERLKSAGYATGYFGKVHTGGPDNGPDKPGFPLNQGFDRFYGTTCGGRVHYLHHSRAAQQRYGRAAGQMEVEPMWDDARQIEWEGFTTVEWTEQAMDFIDRHPDRPWFTFVNYNAVHNFAWQLPDEELEAHGLERVPDWDPEKLDYREWYKGVHRRDWPEGRAYYLAQLACLDREVGRLLDHVDEVDALENTLVIYTVDNGGCVPDWADNGPLAGSKYHLLEGGTRVPMIWRLPATFAAGQEYEGVFSALDLAPTVCALFGVAAEDGAFDGRDQLAQLRGDAEPDELRALHWDTGWQWSVRLGDWKLMVTENEQRARGSAAFEQVAVRMGVHLYDLAADPGETLNLAAARPELVELLRQRHEAWRVAVGQPIEDGM